MKILKEYTDGFRWVDGDTSSAPFEKDSDQYKALIAEGCKVELIPQAEKDAHEQAQARAAFKADRAAKVNSLTVETSLGTFDADEQSQTRMSRAIAVMSDTDTNLWILADNTPTEVTKADLVEALILAGKAQSALWVQA